MTSIKWDRKSGRFVLGNGKRSDSLNSFAVESAMDVSLSSLRRAMASQAGASIPPLRTLPSPTPSRSKPEFNEPIEFGHGGEIVFRGDDLESNVMIFFLSEQGHLCVELAVENPRPT
jgi:hypothetical protein